MAVNALLLFESLFAKVAPMSQDKLIKLISQGDSKGVGKGHVYYTFKNRKNIPGKLSLKKFNPVARKHTVYKEGK
jgi:large subunit ribosomal protein L33